MLSHRIEKWKLVSESKGLKQIFGFISATFQFWDQKLKYIYLKLSFYLIYNKSARKKLWPLISPIQANWIYLPVGGLAKLEKLVKLAGG